MISRFFNPPDQSFFLFGPRGTGKSTWLKHFYPKALWVNLLDPETFRLYAAHPERLRQVLEETSYTEIVIDEVQNVPEILNVVHGLIEEKKNYQFILTGSSARKLKKQGTNLLGGRALLRHMPPFYASELGKDFTLERNVRLGMLPIVLDSPDPEEVLKAYAGIYLKEEVQAEGLVRNVGDFARFLEMVSFSHANLLNASNIARECQIARKTVDTYLQILEDLLLSFQLLPFQKRAKRAVVSHAKFYIFDAGVYNSLRPRSIFDRITEIEGAALEGLCAQHLKAWINAQRQTHHLHFWRTVSQVEVDFILSGPDYLFAIEVKNGTAVHPSDLKGLQSFKEDYPESTPILLYRGKQRFKEKNILCYPIDEFLLKIDPRSPLKF